MAEIADRYDPSIVESRWYREWEERGLFGADPASPKPPYCIVIPPPNVTGSLHWGHALNNTLQDILIRYKRMDGYNALWVPGTDHASIAVHVILERQLAAEGKTRHDIGREAFLERAWAPPATGRASASPWIPGCPAPCARPSSVSSRKVSSTRTTTSSTGARAARPCCRISRWSARSATRTSSTSSMAPSPWEPCARRQSWGTPR